MVRLISGTSGSGKSEKLISMIKDELASSDREIILIVPEQQSVTWTTKMATLLPPTAGTRFTVTTFSFLPNAIFREYGGLADSVVDEGTKALIIWRAMTEVADRLKVFPAGDKGAEDKAVPFLMEIIDEFKQSSISPAKVEEALEELREINLSDENRGEFDDLVDRLSDAVNVYAAYNTILHENFVDRGDVLENLASTLKENPYFRGKSVYLDSFFSLSAHEEKILSLIISQSDNVTITCACPAAGSNREDQIVFDDVKEFMKHSIKLANAAGREIEHIKMSENFRHMNSEEFKAVEADMFTDREIIPREELTPTEDIKIIKCGDRFDEAEAVASIIKKLLHEGYKYSEIAVVARNITSREGILDNVLRRHGIKCFMSESTEISASPAVRLVLAALGVAAGGWQRNDIIRLYKTGMTPVSHLGSGMESIKGDIFESYTFTWNIRGRKMYNVPAWNMNPDGYQESFSDTGKEILKTANEVKDMIIPPLERFLSVFDEVGGVATVREISEAIVTFASEYDVARRLEELATNYDSLGMARDAMRTRKSWDYVCEILDKMVSVLGDVPLNVVRFARLFAGVAAGMDKGTIPTGVDEVVLGSSSGVRLDSVRCAILIGAVEDEFPSSVDDSKFYFNDADKLILETVDLNLSSPTTAMSLSREFFMFYRTALSAREKLYILAPVGGGAALSAPAERTREILAGLGLDAVSVFGKMPLSEILFDRETAEYLLSRRTDPSELTILRSLCREKENSVSLTARNDLVNPEETKYLTLSQSKIDKFIKCKFSYCCNAKIKIKPEKKAEIKSNDIGSFIHAVFEKFFTIVTPAKVKAGISPEEMNALADEIIDEYIASLASSAGHMKGEDDGRLAYLMNRLSRYVHIFLDALAEELAQSKFEPVAFELPIGIYGNEKEAGTPVEFTTESGTRVSLRGIADRVDVFSDEDGKKYVRVIDYKTGAKNFKMELLEHGFDIQMLIYLFSIWKFGLPGDGGEEYIPAGAIYFSTRPNVQTSGTITDVEWNRAQVVKTIKRTGLILNDDKSLHAMDRELSGIYLPVENKERSGLSTTDKSAYLVSLERFGELYEELSSTVTKIASEMLAGHAEAAPAKIKGVKNPCDYCDYAYICRTKEAKD